MGPSGSGKTWLICRLVKYFRARGNKVAVLKHSHKAALAQAPAVSRYRELGVGTIALVGPHFLHLDRSWASEPSPEETLSKLTSAADLVLVEGYKSSPLPQIALGGPDLAGLLPDPSRVVAYVSPVPLDTGLPVFKPEEVEKLGRFIEDYLKLPPGKEGSEEPGGG